MRFVDAQRYDRMPLRGCAFHLPEHGRGGGRVLRQYKYDRLSGVDGVNDLIAIERSGRHVPRRDPAPDACFFQGLTGAFGNGTIQRGVADEDARRTTARLFVVTVFCHSQSPTCAASSRMPYGLATGHGWETRNDRYREANPRRRRTGCGRLLTD